MRPTLLSVLLLLSHNYVALAAPAASEDTDVGPPPTLAPGQAPPLVLAGPLAEPRPLDQIGLPTVLTKWVISPPSSRMPTRAALGQKLFFDGRLSANGTVACATCHNPARAFTDGRPTSIGIYGRVGQRNAPTILNGLYNKRQFWDGRVKTLEQQAAMPITNPFEMGSASVSQHSRCTQKADDLLQSPSRQPRAIRGHLSRLPANQ
jgi:cytochrome c peroxidase